MTEIIHLDQSSVIGKGCYRTVYNHPADSDKCLKIQHCKNKENNFDIRYYKHLTRRNVSMTNIAKFYGEVCTNKGGRGVVFELIKDFDGTISKTLTHYLSKKNERLDSLIAGRLLALKEYLLNERIVFVDIHPSNIVLRKTSVISGDLVIIDALGSHHFLPVSHYIGIIARSMIKRRWSKSIRNKYEKFSYRKDLKPIFPD